ncbi:MAG TPA: hypothetical protein VM327_01260 [Candidatus Thermoplasmatota archaeon]|nr:hypothetical protein [Candidatus Thermoplasmatota archaeon]
MATWEPFAAAAVAPVVVWVLWRLQTVSVDLLRRSLLVLTRHWDQSWMYAIVSWFGTFLHEVSHATVLLLSGHGLKEFRAGVEEGHVLPTRMHGGVGMLFFLAAALAPLYIPPLLALLAIYLVLGVAPIPFTIAGAGLEGVWEAVRPVLVDLPKGLALAIAGLDLADWRHAVVLAIVLLGAPGSRPSHVKSRFHSKGDGGDVAALRRHIRHHPLPFTLFLAVVFGAYFAARWLPQAYWFPLEAVWAVAVTGVVLALFGALVWGLVGLGGRSILLVAWLGPAAFVVVEVAGRALQWPLSVLQLNGVAALAWAVVASVLALVLPRR